LSSGCFENEEGEQFYGKAVAPREQEFRWSNGGLPRIFDPARAAAPPDTDAVRAMFEGLTDYDPQTLKPLPAVAQKWEASEDGRQWTFHLRQDATWSNGDHVTADDFVRSWQRTLRLGERAPHSTLMANIRGARDIAGEVKTASPTVDDSAIKTEIPAEASVAEPPPRHKETFGAEALDARTLRVTLTRPDKNFPALVAHPVFRPMHELSPSAELPALKDEAEGGAVDANLSVITNGAFRLSGFNAASVVLERASNYWAASSVKLNRVRFVETVNAEGALAAYKAGAVDAVTNAAFEPLAVKILTPYKDFRRGTFGALLYYQFNTERPPFNDRRVREAFAAALDVESLSADTLGGATEPASKFLPETQAPDSAGASAGPGMSAADVAKVGEGSESERAAPVELDVERARRLLADAGFPGGVNFPRVRLLVNRNEQQRIVAQAAARMWRSALGVETDVIVREWEEYEALLKTGEYEIARRSMVLQTTDEETNILAMFDDNTARVESDASGESLAPTPESAAAPEQAATAPSPTGTATPETPILTEAQALRELPAVPVYFASSYSLVKPYVSGFHANLLDAPSLKTVQIETGWKPPARRPISVLTQLSLR
jgi:oligopeptide transport system substrate-binding protein